MTGYSIIFSCSVGCEFSKTGVGNAHIIHWDILKCPEYRGGLISGVDLYYIEHILKCPEYRGGLRGGFVL